MYVLCVCADLGTPDLTSWIKWSARLLLHCYLPPLVMKQTSTHLPPMYTRLWKEFLYYLPAQNWLASDFCSFLTAYLITSLWRKWCDRTFFRLRAILWECWYFSWFKKKKIGSYFLHCADIMFYNNFIHRAIVLFTISGEENWDSSKL